MYLLLSITGEKLESKGGISVYIASEFQFGVGLGSSAAFNVSIASALIHYFKLENNDNHDEKYLSIDGEEDLLRPNPSILQQINEWAFEAEKIMHGSPSGIDNSTSTFGIYYFLFYCFNLSSYFFKKEVQLALKKELLKRLIMFPISN